MARIVQKFGGTSVGTIERIKNVAWRVAKWQAAGHRVVVVPSAMSGETNRLLGLASLIQEHPDPRELDVIGATGEQVTVGLLVGSQPDAFVVCHDPLRTSIEGWEDFPLPSPAQVIERATALGRLTNPAVRCVGIALNTSKVAAAERQQLLARYARETGLPCVDPISTGTDAIVSRLLEEFPQP